MPDPQPTLEEMLADPIIQQMMERDHIAADDVRRVIREAREAHRERVARAFIFPVPDAPV